MLVLEWRLLSLAEKQSSIGLTPKEEKELRELEEEIEEQDEYRFDVEKTAC